MRDAVTMVKKKQFIINEMALLHLHICLQKRLYESPVAAFIQRVFVSLFLAFPLHLLRVAYCGWTGSR